MNCIKLLFIYIALFLTYNLQAQDTLYFDKDWHETDKENHMYYRLMPLKEFGSLYYIQDFHKNGAVQMQGYGLKRDPEVFVGDVYWYDENGFDIGFRQYENLTKTKELSYYHPNGEIWQKIKYNDFGKKEEIKVFLNNKEIAFGRILNGEFKGNFSYIHPNNSYSKSQDEENTPYTAHIATSEIHISDEMAISEIPEEVTNEDKLQSFFVDIFWCNGNKASEQHVNIYSSMLNSGKFKYWDESGKLLSQVDYSSENFDTMPFVKYTYYTKNGIAQRITKIEPYKGFYLDGVSKEYAYDGQLTQQSHYEFGMLTKEEKFQNGVLHQTNLYLAGEPYDGIFSIKPGIYKQDFEMHQGQKIGRETWKDPEDNSFFANGEYKDGKPWSGTFVIEDEKNYKIYLNQYKNGLLDGTQKLYQYISSEDPLETYEMVNGKREGIRKVFINEQVLESVYKNDELWEGETYDNQIISSYKNGKLTKTMSTNLINNDNKGDEVFYLENSNIDKVIYRSFLIEEFPQEMYEGNYKDGKPYNGYFKTDAFLDNIPLIDYYENGILKLQYSFNFIEQLDNYNFFTYNQKTTFNNGRIIDGKEFKFVGKERLIEKTFKDGKLIQFDMHLFAMHYYGRYTFIKDNNKITISEMSSKDKLVINKENDNLFSADMWKYDNITHEGLKTWDIEEGSPNSMTIFYVDNNTIKKYNFKLNISADIDHNSNSILHSIFHTFPKLSSESTQKLFESLLATLSQEDIEDAFNFSSLSFVKDIQEDQILGMIQYDEEAKILFGIKITEQKDKSYLVEGIMDNEVKKTLIIKTLVEMLSENKKLLTEFQHQLLDD